MGMYSQDELKARGLIWDGHSLPYNPKLIGRARALRKEMTKAERKLWYEFLRLQSSRFYRQRPIDHYIVDFYCSEAGLIIEVDGSQHYTEEGIIYDKIRSDILATYGLSVFRFTNEEVLTQFEKVCSQLKTAITVSHSKM